MARGAGTPGRRPGRRQGSGRRSRASLARAGSDARVVWPPQARTETARDAVEQLLRERGLAREFPAEVERQARRAAERSWSAERRVDLRELTTFTVDPATARDFDDAISAQRMTDGAVRVWVHIADVAAYVREGSPLDAEARRRATSVYAPGAVEPMLPHALSSGACSLLPGADRAALTVQLDLDGARVLASSFHRSVIRSDQRLDYEQVDRIFAGSQRAPEPWGESLAAARSAAAALADARERQGGLVVESEEPEFEFGGDGEVREIHRRVQTESHRLIEHLMIAANEAVAKRLAELRVPCLYRVHERPDPGRIKELVAQLRSLDVPTPPVPDPLLPAQAADLVAEISRLVDAHVRRTGRGRMALSSLVLRSLKQAYYSPTNLGHAGLHSACYCHFTSPIRRYPDLVCHRALLSTLGEGERPPAPRRLSELGEWTSEREREAVAIERDSDRLAACFHLERALLEEGYDRSFWGEVTGLIPAGAFVAFGPRPAREADARSQPEERGDRQAVYEGLLPARLLESYERERWELNEQRTALRAKRSGARVRLGEEMQVRVVRVDRTRGQVDLAPAGAPEH